MLVPTLSFVYVHAFLSTMVLVGFHANSLIFPEARKKSFTLSLAIFGNYLEPGIEIFKDEDLVSVGLGRARRRLLTFFLR